MNSRLDIVELDRFRTGPSACSYLRAERASFTHRVIPRLSPAAYQELLSRGWRRFGWHFFRPACRSCAKCRSLRILVDHFQPSRSQRRTWGRNADIRMIAQEPTVSAEHLALYNAYHADMRERRGWPGDTISADLYEETFLQGGGGCAREFLFWKDEALIGVALVDLLPEALSSVYFFHDPEYRSRGLGVYSILKQREFAQRHGMRHQYLGYWIAESQSMAYKAQFRPHEILHGSPGDDEAPVWLVPASPPGSP